MHPTGNMKQSLWFFFPKRSDSWEWVKSSQSSNLTIRNLRQETWPKVHPRPTLKIFQSTEIVIIGRSEPFISLSLTYICTYIITSQSLMSRNGLQDHGSHSPTVWYFPPDGPSRSPQFPYWARPPSSFSLFVHVAQNRLLLDPGPVVPKSVRWKNLSWWPSVWMNLGFPAISHPKSFCFCADRNRPRWRPEHHPSENLRLVQDLLFFSWPSGIPVQDCSRRSDRTR